MNNTPAHAPLFGIILRLMAKVLIFCVEFWELSHLTHDLSQAENEITGVTNCASDKMTTIFTQNDNFGHFE